jgi:hypothetical protein
VAGDDPRVDVNQALKSPMRVCILTLFTLDTNQPMRTEPVMKALTTFFPDAKRKQVAYHLTILREARLIPSAS